MRVAWYSPLPPERSGIAAYGASFLPVLRERVDVETVARGEEPPSSDVAVYHVGNDPDRHAWIVEVLRRAPGIVVLHDFVLHHLIVGLTLARGDRAGYLDALRRDGGPAARLLGEGALAGLVPPLWESDADRFPLVREVLADARGVLVHSRYVERKLAEAGYEGPVRRVPLPVAVAEADPAPLAPGRSPVVGSFGFLNAANRIAQLLQAFALLRRERPDALLVLGGAVAPDVRLAPRMRALGLEPERDVLALGHLPPTALARTMAACDVCVSLRGPTMGETSASALQALAIGRPLVVSDVGWFSELPDEVAPKVALDEHEVEALAATLRLLAREASLRETLGAAGRTYARAEHDPERAADAFVAALSELAPARAAA